MNLYENIKMLESQIEFQKHVIQNQKRKINLHRFIVAKLFWETRRAKIEYKSSSYNVSEKYDVYMKLEQLFNEFYALVK